MNNFTEDWFLDLNSKKSALIKVIFKNGKFFDQKTKKEVFIKNNSLLEIRTNIQFLEKDEQKNQEIIERSKFLDKGSILRFHIKNDRGIVEEFNVNLNNDLFIERKGNKSGRLSDVECDIYNGINKFMIKANSLNQAYTRISVIVNPDSKTHNTNVFNSFNFDGQKLENIRPY